MRDRIHVPPEGLHLPPRSESRHKPALAHKLLAGGLMMGSVYFGSQFVENVHDNIIHTRAIMEDIAQSGPHEDSSAIDSNLESSRVDRQNQLHDNIHTTTGEIAADMVHKDLKLAAGHLIGSIMFGAAAYQVAVAGRR